MPTPARSLSPSASLSRSSRSPSPGGIGMARGAAPRSSRSWSCSCRCRTWRTGYRTGPVTTPWALCRTAWGRSCREVRGPSSASVAGYVDAVAGYVDAVHFIEIAPWRVPFVGWVLIACAGIVAVRHRRDPSLLAITLLPQAAAVAGYALFLGELDRYYYLSLMPAAILMVVLAATALPPPRFVGLVGVVLLAVAVALAPGRLRLAATMHQMPEYRLLVEASRRIKNVGQSMQAIRTDFALPRTADPEFLYQVLGGRIDPASPWIALITADGEISYQNVDDSTARL